MSQVEVSSDDLSEAGDPPLLGSSARNVAFALIARRQMLSDDPATEPKELAQAGA